PPSGPARHVQPGTADGAAADGDGALHVRVLPGLPLPPVRPEVLCHGGKDRITLPPVPELDVSTHIDAPADRVWALLADPTRMGEWSPECQRVTWRGRVQTPAL